MITSHPRWARNKLFALLFVTGLAMSFVWSVATNPASAHASAHRGGASASSQVAHAAAAARAADRSLVTSAKALKNCQKKHPNGCQAMRSAVQRAGHRLAITERHLSKLAHYGKRRASTASAAKRAPRLTASGKALSWTRPGTMNTFVFVRKVSGQADQYSVINGSSTTPPPVPGYTVSYSVRTNVSGSTWAAARSIAYPASNQSNGPRTDPQTAPTITVSGQTLTWAQIGRTNTYVLERKVPGQEDQYSEISGTSVTPPAVPGATALYSVRTAVQGSAWAPEVSITYPASAPSPPSSTGGEPVTPPSPPVSSTISDKIIGTNDGAGWGTGAARTILAGHITWNRVEIGMSSNTLAESHSDGFHTLAIVGNVNDGTPLSQVEPNSWGATVVSQLQANPGITIAEAGNEMYLKGNIANPVQYGRMYLAAINAMKAAGIHTPLLFNMLGDYHLGTWSSPTGYSEDAHGGGWLHDAVAGVPGLATAILANGLSTHPYGALGENREDTNGVSAVPAQESVAQTVLGAIPPIYITEFGYSLNNCGADDGACSQPEQAAKMRSAYTALLADPHVAGIWWYQSHDDSTGQFGFMNNDNTTRPSFQTLSTIATEQGQ
jgi:hypothetical protein